MKRYLPSARRISEIGAGGCYILKLLKERGYEVAAIDPGPAAIEKGKEFGIEVISGFYPTQRPIQKSDLILHYDLLEHVDDPVAFLRNHAGDINPGGLVLFAVPDCSPYIAFGDISMILHEHLNYFDEESLRNVVEAAGFEVLEICKGGYGGVLYCTARVVKYRNVCDEKNSMLKFSAFIARTQKLQDQINNFISTGISVGHSLGCYVPLRAIPYLSKLQLTEGVRFFDDNSGIHGQYFDGFSIPVENFQDLKDRPVTHLLVLSFAFGDKLRQKINKGIPQHAINICCLSDFIPHEGVPC